MKRVLLFVLSLLLVGSAMLHAQSPQKITVGGVSFDLAPDYKVVGRLTLPDGEACFIQPKVRPNGERLILKINSEELRNVNGLTEDELKKILFKYVHGNTHIFHERKKLDKKYKILYNKNADGTYFRHCYTYLSWTESDGVHYLSYSEAALVNRTIVCGTAIASDEGELQALTEIYTDVVTAANE